MVCFTLKPFVSSVCFPLTQGFRRGKCQKYFMAIYLSMFGKSVQMHILWSFLKFKKQGREEVSH